MSDLRDQLVRRLSGVGQGIEHRERAQAREVYESFYRALADEVIRQMEWARHDAMREFVTDDAKEVRRDLAKLLLTLAPEDWKP